MTRSRVLSISNPRNIPFYLFEVFLVVKTFFTRLLKTIKNTNLSHSFKLKIVTFTFLGSVKCVFAAINTFLPCNIVFFVPLQQ